MPENPFKQNELLEMSPDYPGEGPTHLVLMAEPWGGDPWPVRPLDPRIIFGRDEMGLMPAMVGHLRRLSPKTYGADMVVFIEGGEGPTRLATAQDDPAGMHVASLVSLTDEAVYLTLTHLLNSPMDTGPYNADDLAVVKLECRLRGIDVPGDDFDTN